MTAEQLAILFLQQLRAHLEGEASEPSEVRAIDVWERLIVDDPEQAWPVFEHALSRAWNDDALEYVWYRLRLLLYRHYSAFHERAAELLSRHPRFVLIAGPDAVDPKRYDDKEFDREELIEAYRTLHRTHTLARQPVDLARSNPERALWLAVEIIHRGCARGWSSFDLMSPLDDILVASGPEIIAGLEKVAKESVAVRRVLWRMKRQSVMRRASADVWSRVETAIGSTTDYTESDIAIPPPQQQLEADERIIEAWFENEENFWAFSAMSDLCDEDPRLAWSITLELIERADDEYEIGVVAAGPLEDLIRKHTDTIWADVVEKAHTNPRLAAALQGVWVFEDDGDVFHRFNELLQELQREPN